MTPQIVIPDSGKHNADLGLVGKRLDRSQSYQDLSTVIICPSRGVVPCKVISSWLGLLRPMNQKVFGPLFGVGMEVGNAYQQMVEMILGNPTLSKFKYLLTIEEDNILPPDGLLKLYEAIEGKVNGQKYDVVGGLYFTKGEAGAPMIYGSPSVMPKNFIPQIPIPDTVQEANGLGMGFNLFRMAMFNKIEKPWFKSVNEFTPGVGSSTVSQDLFFYSKAAGYGYRFASVNSIKVGHYDYEGIAGPPDTVW